MCFGCRTDSVVDAPSNSLSPRRAASELTFRSLPAGTRPEVLVGESTGPVSAENASTNR